MTESRATEPLPERALRTPGQPVSILLVDDDPNNLLALESILETPEYHLVRAQTADQALLALMNGEYAAIVLDVQMPEIDGIELARLIKQRRKTQHIPILFLTAHYRDNEDMVLGYDVGAVDYLTKPVHPAVLRSKVAVFVELFRKTRALAEANAELEAKNLALEHQAEDRLRRIQAEAAQAEAEAANAAKDRFLAMLSHELRTPLSPVLHAVTLLEDQSNGSPEMQPTLDIIRRNVQLEARLIDDLLDLARTRNGKLQLQLVPVDVHDLLQHALKICEPEIAARHLAVDLQCRARQTRLLADPARLQQVFWNLISNAVKFTPENGRITVSTRNDASGSHIQLAVTDTGVGIEPAALPRIFDAFEQITPKASSGLGLGLAICKALAEYHGGRIDAESAGRGHGSTFTVTLPASAELAVPERATRSETPERGVVPLRLLVVEDHGDTAAILVRLLARRGYQVESAGNVSEARAAAQTREFDVLVTDIGLPDGNGVELFAQLKSEPRHTHLRAVALSGFGAEADVHRTTEAGFAAHLVKPVDLAQLERVLRELAVA